MDSHARMYIGAAFVAGIILTLGFRDVFPELKELFRKPRNKTLRSKKDNDEAATAADALMARSGPPAIVDGIEGCIGNTPLLRIKSLSEATGCEILAKAEACSSQFG